MAQKNCTNPNLSIQETKEKTYDKKVSNICRQKYISNYIQSGRLPSNYPQQLILTLDNLKISKPNPKP